MSLRLIDLSSGDELYHVQEVKNFSLLSGWQMWSGIVSPAGGVAVGDEPQQLHSLLSGEAIRKIPLLASTVFSPDGLFASGIPREKFDTVQLVSLWFNARQTYELKGRAIMQLAFSPDSRWLVAADSEGLVRLWDAGSSAAAATTEDPDNRPPTLTLKEEKLNLMAGVTGDLTLTGEDPDGDPLVFQYRIGPDAPWQYDGDGVIKVRPTGAGMQLEAQCVDGRGGVSPVVSHRFEVAPNPWLSWRQLRSFEPDPEKPLEFAMVTLDGRRQTAGQPAQSGRSRPPAGAPAGAPGAGAPVGGLLSQGPPLRGQQEPPFRAVDFTADGRTLALSGTDSGLLKIMKLPKDPKPLAVQSNPTQSGRGAFSPDGKLFAIGTDAGTVHLWTVPAGKLRSTAEEKSTLRRDISEVAFDPEGDLVAGAGRRWRRSHLERARRQAGPPADG